MLPCETTPEVKLQDVKYLPNKNSRFFSFLAMTLSEFSKTFGISESKKGFFHHKFNLPSNQNYIGAYPLADYYQSEYFNVKKKKQFDEW